MLHKTTIILSFLTGLSTSQTFAMQSLNDELMSSVTGQDGITAQVYSNGISIDKVLWHDNDGLQPTLENGITDASAGAVVIDTLNITPKDTTSPLLNIRIDSDGGLAVDGAEAMLNVAIELAAIDISLDAISVAGSNPELDFSNPNSGARRGTTTNSYKIIDTLDVSLGKLNFNIQLGHEAQGHLMRISGTMENGIQISNFGVLADGNSQYAFSMGDVKITDTGSNDLTFRGTGVDIDTTGLIITPSQRTMDITSTAFTLGGTTNSTALGGMSISGLDLGNKIMILGH